MPPTRKERFNAKARQSSVGSSHKKRRKTKAARQEGEQEDDGEHRSGNAVLIDSQVDAANWEADRRRRKLLAAHDESLANAPISSKKRKRLDAYITRQLKKENRQKLMADLAKSGAQVDDRSTLMTAATLGTGKIQTGQERLQHETAKIERAQRKRRGGTSFAVQGASDDESEEELFNESSDGAGDTSLRRNGPVDSTERDRESRISAARALFAADKPDSKGDVSSENGGGDVAPLFSAAIVAEQPVLGSALALGPDGKALQPTMKVRKKPAAKRLGRKTAWGRNASLTGSEDDESDFDSSDSAFDSEESERESEEQAQLAMGKKKEAQSDEDESASSLGDEEDDEDGSDLTDEEEQRILEEAMRRRGMLGDPSKPVPNFDEEDVEDTSEREEEEMASESGSLPFAAFNDANALDDEEWMGENEYEEENEEEGVSVAESVRSDRNESASGRRGLPSTMRSVGFKDWAKEALGLGHNSVDQEEDDGVYRGPEPVAGLTTKVSDLMDGKIRGPLGAEEPSMQDRSAFAQKFYQEAAASEQKGRLDRDRVPVKRPEDAAASRLMLPVLAEEERIVRTIKENMITVLCGETGSGKTTQVPQFLYEAGFGSPGSSNPGMIGITQPRRVAALSMASRVAKELNLSSSVVSHQIRYDATVSSSTSIKFMTDGVLLRELAADFLLTKYSAVIIDEAHERSVNTDVLIGILSRVVKLRAKRWIEGQGRPLRMIIMSATLRVEDFTANTRLFDEKPPVIEVDARQYPVVTHFNRRTTHDYVTESVKKASKIHARLPPGGILIFLTGQAEISTVCRKLEKRYGRLAIQERLSRVDRSWKQTEAITAGDTEDKIAVPARIGDVEVEEMNLSLREEREDEALALDFDDGRVEQEDEDGLDTDDEDGGADYDADLPAELRDDTDVAMHILPLYSLLPSDKQMRVFEPPPPDTRLVVVATNVAETSLTIPGITYVVDCGRSKERKCDAQSNVQSFEVGFISKASANQRAGRAGRTGPGHCYRLYSSNVYEEHFVQFAHPEILRTPVDNLVLMMKAMNIDNVANFPFPTPPDRQALRRAENLLLRLGALEAGATDSKRAVQHKVTELGRLMSLFPLNSRLSKLLVQGHQFDCLPFVIALVAALSVGDPFVKEQSLHEVKEADEGEDDELPLPVEAQHLHNESEKDKERRKATKGAYHKTLHQFASLGGALSDPLRLLSAVGAYEHSGGTLDFCRQHYLVPKTMQEIHKLRAQLSTMVQANAEPGVDWSNLSNPRFTSPPTAKQTTILRQFLAAAFIDQVAIRADLAPESAARVPMLQESSSADYKIAKQFQHQLRNGAKMKSTRDVAYLAMGISGEACFIHNTSVLYHQPPPEWIIFGEVLRGRARGEQLEFSGRNWLKGVTKINPNWIHKLGKSLCSFGRTIDADSKDSRSRLIEAAKELKRHNAEASASRGGAEKQIYVVPTYGNGPAFDMTERSSHLGWELPAVAAKQRLIGGRWVTQLG